jgi:hypothetical protein
MNNKTNSFAFATLVMLDPEYTLGALALAHSLRKVGTKADLIVMVTQDIPQFHRDQLATLYDRIIEVPYLQVPIVMKQGFLFKEYYRKWIDRSFTKFNVLTITDYDKVALIDSDMLALSNPDEVFLVQTPAGICSTITDDTQWHGKNLSEDIVQGSLEEYGMRGCLWLLKPNMSDYDHIRKELESLTVYGDKNRRIAPDELYMTKFYKNDWHHLHKRYGHNSWKIEELTDEVPVFAHFVTAKPWNSIKKWPDFKIWDEMAKDMIIHHPSLCTLFKEVNMINRLRELGFSPEVMKTIESYVDRKTHQVRIPVSDYRSLFEKYGYNTIVTHLSNLISKGIIGFPYKRLCVDDNQIDETFLRLKQHLGVEIIVDDYDIPSTRFVKDRDTLFPNTFDGQRLVYISDPKDYTIDVLSDYFSEECRMNAKRIDSVKSPMRYWLENSRTLLCDIIDNKLIIDTHQLREALYHRVKECTSFKATLAKYVINKLGGTRVLDFSAGWGDRLLGAIAQGVARYVGFDPNEALKESHQAIISRFGNGQHDRFSVRYQPFQSAEIGDEKFDLVFTTPPFFNLERYTHLPNQSIDDFPQFEDWVVNFLFTSIDKCWANLEVGGHLAIHVADTRQTKICEVMNLFIQCVLAGARYRGILATRAEGGSNKVLPIWVYQKMKDSEPRRVEAASEQLRRRHGRVYTELAKKFVAIFGDISDHSQQRKRKYEEEHSEYRANKRFKEYI